VRNTHATSRHSARSVGDVVKFADDWEQEREKHQKTLNGTQFASAGTTADQELSTQNWLCVDNTSCEIQLSLVEQQQKLLNQKRQASAKLQSSSNAGLRNGHSDARMHSVLSSVDNRHICSNTCSHSKSQGELVHCAELYHGSESRGSWSDSVGDFKPVFSWHNNTYANGSAHKPPPDVPPELDNKQVRERELDVSEEQTTKKLKRLQHLRGSQKSSKLRHIGLKFGRTVCQ